MNRFTDASQALRYIMSGKATVTLVSRLTGQRFTYRVERPRRDIKSNQKDNGFRFVRVLSGPDNNTNYTYMGSIVKGNFSLIGRTKFSTETPSVRAFDWILGWLTRGNLQGDKIEIWHEGRCGKCGKRLTVPASIESGLGPECIRTAFVCN